MSGAPSCQTAHSRSRDFAASKSFGASMCRLKKANVRNNERRNALALAGRHGVEKRVQHLAVGDLRGHRSQLAREFVFRAGVAFDSFQTFFLVAALSRRIFTPSTRLSRRRTCATREFRGARC